MSSLEGRTALVTGAGHGLGAAISGALHREGARVVLSGRDRARLAETAASLGADRTRIAPVDVSQPGSVQALADELAGEEVDVLVNNAGIAGPVAPLTDVDPADWDEVFAVNVRGTFLMCRAFLPAMVAAGRGDVVNLASVSGKRPLAGRTPYCASKMAVLGLGTTLAFEVGPAGVRVNTLSPGPVEGPRMERNFAAEAARTGRSAQTAREAFVGRSALGRMVTADEVGEAVLAILATPGMTGADVDLSAGMVA